MLEHRPLHQEQILWLLLYVAYMCFAGLWCCGAAASSHEHKLAKHQAIPLADIVVGQGSAIVQLHTIRHQALQKSWNTGDVLYLCLDVVDGVGSLDLQRERKGLMRQMDEEADGSSCSTTVKVDPLLIL